MPPQNPKVSQDPFLDAMKGVVADWSQIEGDPEWRKMSTSDRMEHKSFYWQNNILSNPAIKDGFRENPDIMADSFKAFNGPELQEAWDRSEKYNHRATALPTYWALADSRLGKALGMKKADDIDVVEHPWQKAAWKFGEGLTSIEQLSMIGATMEAGPAIKGISKLAGMSPAAIATTSRTIQGLTSNGFAVDTIYGAYKRSPEVKEYLDLAHKSEQLGDAKGQLYYEKMAESTLVEMGLGATVGYFAARSGLRDLKSAATGTFHAGDIKALRKLGYDTDTISTMPLEEGIRRIEGRLKPEPPQSPLPTTKFARTPKPPEGIDAEVYRRLRESGHSRKDIIAAIEQQKARTAEAATPAAQQLLPTGKVDESHPFFQYVKDVKQGIVYHGTTEDAAAQIEQSGIAPMSINQIVKGTAKRLGVDLTKLSPEQKEELGAVARSYNMQLGKASFAASKDIASRWAGKGGEIDARVAAILSGSEKMEEYRGGKPAIVKGTLTEAGKQAPGYRSYLTHLGHLEDDVRSGAITPDQALDHVRQHYHDIRVKPDEVSLPKKGLVSPEPEDEAIRRGAPPEEPVKEVAQAEEVKNLQAKLEKNATDWAARKRLRDIEDQKAGIPSVKETPPEARMDKRAELAKTEPKARPIEGEVIPPTRASDTLKLPTTLTPEGYSAATIPIPKEGSRLPSPMPSDTKPAFDLPELPAEVEKGFAEREARIRASELANVDRPMPTAKDVDPATLAILQKYPNVFKQPAGAPRLTSGEPEGPEAPSTPPRPAEEPVGAINAKNIGDVNFTDYKSAHAQAERVFGKAKATIRGVTKANGETVYRVTPPKVSEAPDVSRPSPPPSESSPKEPPPPAAAQPPTGESVPTSSGEQVKNIEDIGRRLEKVVPKKIQMAFAQQLAEATAIKPGVKLDLLKSANEKFLNHVRMGMDPKDAFNAVLEDLKKWKGQQGFLSFRPTTNFPGSGVLTKIMDKLENLGELSDEEQQTRNVMRALLGRRHRSIDQLYARFGELEKKHEGDTVSDFIQNMNAGQRKPGSSFLVHEDQAFADAAHEIFADLWQQLKNVNPDRFHGNGLENYMGRLFTFGKDRDLAAQLFNARSPLAGRSGFAKPRVHEWIEDSIAAGAKPITNNFVKMQMQVMEQMDKYISAHQSLAEMKERGLVQWATSMKDVPQSWRSIDDPIFQPRLPKDGGFMQFGRYYAHPDVAKIFNKYFRPGLRDSKTYNTLRAIGDFQNQMQLGFSAFHGTFSTVAGAAVSDVARGMEQIFSYGKPLQGLGNIAKGLTIAPSALGTYRLGHMMEQEWLAPGTYPFLSKYADLMEQTGGKLGGGLNMDRQRIQDFRQAWQESKTPYTLLTKGFPAAAEKTSRWLMRYYVPRLKMGVFAKMAEDSYGKLVESGASHDQIATSMGKIWDSVDNRLGQLVYDRQFWNRTTKDLAQLSVRSVGWNWGTYFGEIGPAVVKDLPTYIRGKLAGSNPELTHRLAYTMALPVVAGTIGAVMTYAFTGQGPRQLEDYFFPKTGGTDDAGNPERLSIPTYMRDVFGTSHAPLSTAVHKLHPMWQQFAELYQNADFYGVEIRHTGDSFLSQAYDVATYLAKNQITPISWSSASEQRRAGVDWVKSTALSELGFTPAPRWVGQTKAEDLAYEFSKRHLEVGPKTKEEFEKRKYFSQLRSLYHSGKLKDSDIDKAFDQGKITESQYNSMFDEKDMSPFERHLSRLDVSELVRIWNVANANEKASLRDIIEDKADALPEADYDALKPQIEKILGQ